MSVLNCVHHINFIVADIDAAVEAYRNTLGLGPFEYEQLPDRDVVTARVLVGDVWIVLVSPQREDSVAGRYLSDHGEGFFLMSFGVEDLDLAVAELTQRGAMPADSESRSGLLGWRVADLETEDSLGVRFHVTQTTKPNQGSRA
jgi:methylmalonyl-CoA/ethylmalonyl-CoA epimerase